ncbi:MAG: hydroxylamine reductase [Candidatus Omnitrophica bacterium]|nr:hydroxylamine reductase [Candidatus Omnitrophota bacterium]
MFCFQCQETVRNQGCTIRGVCGKPDQTANLQDLIGYVCKGISFLAEKGTPDLAVGRFVARAMFSTITNANFDDDRMIAIIKEGLTVRDALKQKICSGGCSCSVPDCVSWTANTNEALLEKSKTVGVLATSNEDVRSLQQLLIYGIKGISAYATHASVLGYEDPTIFNFIFEGLASTVKSLPVDEMVGLVMKCGQTAVTTMALLDKANTSTYGKPEITKVNIGVRKNPGILISGHDLKDMEELLKQTEGTGVDVYTHSEMLPANYYPAFKKYSHFVGNYGGSWWHQNDEFESFNGPILMTTNCIIPVKESYKNRFFTTGMAGYPGVTHLPEPQAGKPKDFSEIITLAKKCSSPKELETGEIVGGFAHDQILALADTVVAAVKSGAIKRFVVMAGCDGRFTTRKYFTDVAETLPKDTIILTAGCAKYRYNKLKLGDIGGIPRVLDAGQCNDSYSLALVALKLKEVFGLQDVNELPLSFDIAWYEQKAVAVLLAVLSLGFKNIRLGPTLPAFLSPNIAKVLVEKFDIKPTTEAETDVAAMMAGK